MTDEKAPSDGTGPFFYGGAWRMMLVFWLSYRPGSR